MTRILLGQAYHLRFDPKLWVAMQPYPPLGSLYAAAVLSKNGYEVAFHDSMLSESESDWDTALERERPDVAVLYEDNFNYLSKMCLLRMREAAFRMIGSARRRGCTTIVCSSDASDRPHIYLEAGADFVLIGEGEETLLEVLDPGRSAHEVSGLAFIDDGDLQRTSPRGVIRNLDSLPFPAWDLVDISRYRKMWRRRHGFFSLNMASSRGCPFHCNWCAKPIWGQRYNVRSPESVVAELKMLKERYEPDHIWFMDDMIGIKPGWMRGFAERVHAEGVRTPFKCLNRVDLLLREGEIDALRDAGCRIVWTGVESGSQRILDAMDKGIRVEQIHAATVRLRAAGIKVGYFLQLGYPGETRADIEKTFRIVRECSPDQIGVSVSYPLPGTKFFEAVRMQLGEKQNWTDSDDLAMMYQGPFSTEFYRATHTALHKEFRMRKAVRSLRNPLQRPIPLMREAAALAYHGATLPLARIRMGRASRIPHRGVDPIKGRLSPEEAAIPTLQEAGELLPTTAAEIPQSDRRS